MYGELRKTGGEQFNFLSYSSAERIIFNSVISFPAATAKF